MYIYIFDFFYLYIFDNLHVETDPVAAAVFSNEIYLKGAGSLSSLSVVSANGGAVVALIEIPSAFSA